MAKILQSFTWGFGGLATLYYGQAAWQIYNSHRESSHIEQTYTSEVRAAAAAESDAQRQESLISTLKQKVQQYEQDLVNIDTDLKIAREKVSQLETQRSKNIEEAAAAVATIEKGHSHVRELLKSVQKHRANAELAHEALLAAKLRGKEVDALLNPVNHPIIKSLIGK